MFVHLTHESRLKKILRVGINKLRKFQNGERGLYAMPVTRNFYVSHQWLRELKRGEHRGGGPIVGIYFRIPDEEIITVGHFNQAHQKMTAAQAVATISSNIPAEGFEVIIYRKISASEIHRSRELPQVIGWRYYPEAHGKKPCGCPYCQRGQYGGRKLIAEYERDF
jgi:hypothetical protein